MMDGFHICMNTNMCFNFCLFACYAPHKFKIVIRLLFYYRFVGNLLKGQTVGVIGAGRIGSAYARMMVNFFSYMNCMSIVIV